MPKAIELRKVIKILKAYGIEFDSKSSGKHSGKFIKGNKSFPVKAHGQENNHIALCIEWFNQEI